MNLWSTLRWRAAIVAAAGVLLTAACAGGGGDYDSPILNEDVPAVDIANLPDIDQTRAQMLSLIERVRTDVARLVPASEPWRWNREESTSGCTQQGTGRKGVSLYFANLVSTHAFTDAEWASVFPMVKRLADEAGLAGESVMQNSTGSHDIRFHSDDGRTLMFGSEVASLITGSIACRRSAP